MNVAHEGYLCRANVRPLRATRDGMVEFAHPPAAVILVLSGLPGTCHGLKTVPPPSVSRRSARGGRGSGIDGGVARFTGGNRPALAHTQVAFEARKRKPIFATLKWRFAGS